jgi:hypothetical protein
MESGIHWRNVNGFLLKPSTAIPGEPYLSQNRENGAQAHYGTHTAKALET